MSDHFYIKNQSEVKKLMKLALEAGNLLVQSGAETYRIEDTMIKICNSRKNIERSESFVAQTLILIAVEYEGNVYTDFKRVSNGNTNLNQISYVNQFSRDFQHENISIDDGLNILKNSKNIHKFSMSHEIFFGGLCGGAFAVMFGGNFNDFIASFIASVCTITCYLNIIKIPVTFFVSSFLGALLASIFSYITIKIGIGVNLDKIIIGAIMYLVPGVALTNAIRDTMNGDSLSGLSKGMEAILTALAIAFGAGVIVNLYSKGVI